MSDHDEYKAGNPPEVDPDRIELYCLREENAKLTKKLVEQSDQIVRMSSVFGFIEGAVLEIKKEVLANE